MMTTMTPTRTDIQWFTEARFGMFIHWGLYSGPGGVWQGRKLKHTQAEWLQALARIPRAEYRRLAESFNPVAFDAEDWVCEARLAGMRYLVITANVGPMGDGRFQPAAVARLRELGAWLQANGESIYGAERSPFGKPAWGRVTARTLSDGRRRLYLHLWNVTPGTALRLDGVPAPTAAAILETGQPVRFGADADGVWLQLPEELRGLQLPVLVLDHATE